jgi:hypothetical protein
VAGILTKMSGVPVENVRYRGANTGHIVLFHARQFVGFLFGKSGQFVRYRGKGGQVHIGTTAAHDLDAADAPKLSDGSPDSPLAEPKAVSNRLLAWKGEAGDLIDVAENCQSDQSGSG